jgi:TPR repeat protein
MLAAMAQQDEGPILRPRKPVVKKEEPSLLVLCDLACNWKLDGESKGLIEAGGAAKMKVELGQHLVVATTPDGLDKVDKILDIEAAKQTLVRIELAPVHELRLKNAQAAKDKTEQDAKNNAALEKKPAVKPESSSLLVLCDLTCNWKLDGEPKGSIVAGGSAKVEIVLGQHLLVATTTDGLDEVEKDLDIEAAKQTMARVELMPKREARFKIEQEAKDKTEQDAKNKDALDKPAANDAAGLQELQKNAAAHFSQASSLNSQKRYEEARPLYEKACEGGERRGCNDLGLLYEKGYGVSQDYAQAHAFFQKACDNSVMAGCKNLGKLYELGLGVSQDYSQARTLYQKACDGGEMIGCNNLGVLYNNGQGLPHDFAQARAFYQKACDGGEMKGCTNLGVIYDNGDGLPHDYAKARALYQKACSGGEEVGCKDLGWFYFVGQGVSRDYLQARVFFEKACDGGEMMGCNDLGVLYDEGNGVRRDIAQARSFYKKACDGGVTRACTNLRTLH